MSDIARDVGCSQAAVSYAIHGNHPIGEELRTRIFDSIERLGYHPYNKKKLREGKAIALISMSSPCDNYGDDVILREIMNNGYLPISYYLPLEDTGYLTREMVMNQIRNQENLAGIISTHPRISSMDLLRFTRQIPVTIHNRPESMLSSSFVDFSEVGRMLRRIIRQSKHRKIAFISFGEYTSPEYQLIVKRGLRPTAESTSDKSTPFEFSDVSVPANAMSHDILDPQLDALIRNGYTFFFAQSIGLCAMFLKWAKSRHLEIPKNASVMYMDIDEYLEDLKPEVTAIKVNNPEIAKQTVQSILAKIKHSPANPSFDKPILVEKGTVIPFQKTIPAAFV